MLSFQTHNLLRGKDEMFLYSSYNILDEQSSIILLHSDLVIL